MARRGALSCPPGYRARTLRNSVVRQRAKDPVVHGLQHFPVDEARYAFRPERADLDELVLVDAVSEPALPGEPPDAAQHEGPGVAAGDDPPVDRRSFDDLGRTDEIPALPDEPAEECPCPPRPRESVPAEAPAHAVEVGVDPRRRSGRERYRHAHGVHAFAEPALEGEQIVVECSRLGVERDRQRVGEANDVDPERGVGARLVGHDHFGDETLDEGVADAAIDGGDQVQPVRRQPGSQVRHVEDPAPVKSAGGRVGRDHLAIRGDVGAADLVDARLHGERADEIADHVAQRDRLDRGADPAGADHEREALGEVAEHLERDAPGAEHDRRAQLDDRDPSTRQRGADFLTAREVFGCRVVAEAAEIDDAADTARRGRPPESLGEPAVVGAEVARAERVHEVVGDLVSGQGVAQRVLVAYVDRVAHGARQVGRVARANAPTSCPAPTRAPQSARPTNPLAPTTAIRMLRACPPLPRVNPPPRSTRWTDPV